MPYKDPVKKKEYNINYYYNHKEKDNLRCKLRHQQHKEEDNTKSRIYHQTHKDIENSRRRTYHYEHLEQDLKNCRAWYAQNKEQDNVKSREYQQKHKERLLPMARQRGLNRRLLAMLVVSDGNLFCVNCGCDYIPFLEINHKNGGGTTERKLDAAKGSHFTDNIINGNRKVDDLEITCRICNALHYLKQKDGEQANKFTIIWSSETSPSSPLSQSQYAGNQPVLRRDLIRQA